MKKNKIYIILIFLFSLLVLFLWMKKNPIAVLEILPPIMEENSTDTSTVKLVFRKMSAPNDLIVHGWIVGGDIINDVDIHSSVSPDPPEPGDASSLSKNNIIFSLSSSCDCFTSKELPTFQNTDTFLVMIDDVSPFRLSKSFWKGVAKEVKIYSTFGIRSVKNKFYVKFNLSLVYDVATKNCSIEACSQTHKTENKYIKIKGNRYLEFYSE